VAGYVYGLSLLQRAYDDIMRDARIAEATGVAIEFNGFRRIHARMGQPGEDVPREAIEEVTDELGKLVDGKKRVVATVHDVELSAIDDGALPANEYFQWTTDRLCTALGVPEEILGLGRGSTEATANVRRKAWNDKIGAFQRKVARCINLQLNDRITRTPGVVKLIFNDVDPEDESKVADLIMKLMSNAADPELIISAKMARKRLNFDEEEYQADMEEELDESIAATPEQLKPFVDPNAKPEQDESEEPKDEEDVPA